MGDVPVRVPAYEAPRIENRTEIAPTLIAGPAATSPVPTSAAFRPSEPEESR
jgi:hypothetical protein